MNHDQELVDARMGLEIHDILGKLDKIYEAAIVLGDTVFAGITCLARLRIRVAETASKDKTSQDVMLRYTIANPPTQLDIIERNWRIVHEPPHLFLIPVTLKWDETVLRLCQEQLEEVKRYYHVRSSH